MYLNMEYRELLSNAKEIYDKEFSKYWTAGDGTPKYDNISNEEFEKRIIENPEFAKKWGFQVYTRELSKSERMDYWFKNNKPNRDVCDSVDESAEEEQHKYFDGANVPKRAISLTYNNQTIEIYE